MRRVMRAFRWVRLPLGRAKRTSLESSRSASSVIRCRRFAALRLAKREQLNIYLARTRCTSPYARRKSRDFHRLLEARLGGVSRMAVTARWRRDESFCLLTICQRRDSPRPPLRLGRLYLSS
jgi:hypothetical protein